MSLCRLAPSTDGNDGLRLHPPSVAGRIPCAEVHDDDTVQNAAVRLAGQLYAANGLALVRLTIGAMFIWVFFENLGKGAYTPAGYAGLINYYIKGSRSPAARKAIMGLVASYAATALPCRP